MADNFAGDGLEDTLAEAMVEQKIDPSTGEITPEPPKEQVYEGTEKDTTGRQDPDRQSATQDYPREDKAGKADADSESEREPEGEKIDPRSYWNKEQQDFFARQSPEAQKTILSMFDKMQYVYDRKTQDLAEAAGEVQAAAQQIEPMLEYQEMVEKYLPEGMNYNQYIDELVGSDYLATSNPVEFVCKFIIDNNLHIDQIMAYGKPYYKQQTNPVYQQYSRTQAEKQRLEEQLQEQYEAQQAARDEQVNEVMDEALSDFQSELDDNGELKYPYLADVEDEMAHLMLTTGEINLPTLYEKACWTNPDIREELISMRNGAKNSMPNMARGFGRGAGAATSKNDDLDNILREAAMQPGATLLGKPF